MRLLLDTHIFLWWLEDSPKLSAAAREKILDASVVYVSSASIWEAAIKAGLGKLDVDVDVIANEIAVSGFRELPVSVRHAAMVAHLPELQRDPFDRILIAQAMAEPLGFMTADSALRAYSEQVLLV